MKKIIGLGLALAMLAACSVQNAYVYPENVKQKYVITTGDVDQPYDSLGYIQVTKTGATLFGFVDILDADLEGLFEQDLLDEIEKAGADGLVNMHFHETQYTDATRTLFAMKCGILAVVLGVRGYAPVGQLGSKPAVLVLFWMHTLCKCRVAIFICKNSCVGRAFWTKFGARARRSKFEASLRQV